jgi:hypothetical protein
MKKAAEEENHEKTGSWEDIPQFAFISELEAQLGLPQGFCHALLEEDDWSFIIKLHSLVEAAVTQLVVETIGLPELHSIFSRLDLSGTSSGKMAFVKELSLLTDDERRFIAKLSEVRNDLVHNISNVSADLHKYYLDLSESDRKGFDKAFRWGHKTTSSIAVEVSEGEYSVEGLMHKAACLTLDFAKELDCPLEKVAIWTGSIILLRQIHFNTGTAIFRRKKVAMELEHGAAAIKLVEAIRGAKTASGRNQA